MWSATSWIARMLSRLSIGWRWGQTLNHLKDPININRAPPKFAICRSYGACGYWKTGIYKDFAPPEQVPVFEKRINSAAQVVGGAKGPVL